MCALCTLATAKHAPAACTLAMSRRCHAAPRCVLVCSLHHHPHYYQQPTPHARAMETWEELQERHRSEIRALKAEVMRVKKSASVGDKKKKKDSVVQIAQMESDLADRQSREEREFREAHKDLFASPAPSADTANAVPVAENQNADTESQSEASPVPRVTRAAKRRVRDVSPGICTELTHPRRRERLKRRAKLGRRQSATLPQPRTSALRKMRRL